MRDHRQRRVWRLASALSSTWREQSSVGMRSRPEPGWVPLAVNERKVEPKPRTEPEGIEPAPLQARTAQARRRGPTLAPGRARRCRKRSSPRHRTARSEKHSQPRSSGWPHTSPHTRSLANPSHTPIRPSRVPTRSSPASRRRPAASRSKADIPDRPPNRNQPQTSLRPETGWSQTQNSSVQSRIRHSPAGQTPLKQLLERVFRPQSAETNVVAWSKTPRPEAPLIPFFLAFL
jgi:hypothetical protein